jgi:threonine/homoserine/homoserine lactone efflux protein
MNFISIIGLGAVLGLSAGISPGPLLTLVISETLRHNRREGIKVALSPLITDVPVILASVFILAQLGRSAVVLGLISISGSIFVLCLGYECLKTREILPDLKNQGTRSLRKGIVANLLNPHPYLFWVTVGTPIVLKAWQISIFYVVAFFLTFYLLLVGSKIGVAMLVHRSKNVLNNKAYIWIMRTLGMILLVFAVLFLLNGFKLVSGASFGSYRFQ